MISNEINRELQDLQQHLQQLNKAQNQLARAVPNPEQASKTVDGALVRVIDSLKQDEVVAILDNLIIQAREMLLTVPAEFDTELLKRQEEFISAETRVVQDLSLRREDVVKLTNLFRVVKEDDRKQFASSTTELCILLEDTLQSSKEELIIARTMPRKKKKKYKREIAKGVWSVIFGAGMIIANTQVPSLGVFSYAVGAGAMYNAGRDFIP